jgi:hypothetical protein
MRFGAGITVALALLGAVGCSAPPNANQGDEAGLTEGPRPHAEAVLACEASFEERAGSSPSRDAIVDYAACLEAADRIVQPRVETLVGRINASLAAQADVRLEQYRAGADSLCDLLARATIGDYDAEVTCAADMERLLADLIDAYVDLDTPPRLIEAARAAHPVCYDAFDVDVAAEADLRDANDELATCIEDRTRLRRPVIAQALAESGIEEAPQLVEQGFGAVYDASRAACEIVCAASDAGGGSLARLYSASCRVDVAHRLDAIAAN